MNNDEIMVSVAVIAYKHAKYLPTCINSILQQKTNFKIEIVVGEDGSEDGSKEILEKYAENNPGIFVLLINEANLGAAKNAYNVGLHCKGKYIASLEGDDFWIDNCKLQKQVDYLETHPDCSATGTNCIYVDNDGNNGKVSLRKWEVERKYTLKDYFNKGMIIHSNTICRRNNIPLDTDAYRKMRFAAASMGDIITRVLMYDQGYIYVFKDIALAHRDGVNDSTSYTHNQVDRSIEYSYMYITRVEAIDEYLGHKYNLSPLIENRTALILMNGILRRTKLNKDELREYLHSLPIKTRKNAYLKVVKKLGHAVIKHIGLKLNL